MAKAQPVALTREELEEDELPPQQFQYNPHGGIQINKGGRPRKRRRITDEGVIEEICMHLIAGKGLYRLLLEENTTLPTPTEVYNHLARDPEGPISRAIAHAREVQQQAIMDKCEALAATVTPENYNAVKTQIWWHQWHASKLKPSKYGDKIVVDQRTQNLNVTLSANEFTTLARNLLEDT